MRQAQKRGLKLFPRNTAEGRGYWEIRQGYIDAKGGDDAVSPQQLVLIDEIMRETLLIDTTDAYLIELGSKIINRRFKRLAPIVAQRHQLADSRLRHLQALGLERVAKRPPTLAEYLRSRSLETSPSAPATSAGSPDALAGASATEAQS